MIVTLDVIELAVRLVKVRFPVEEHLHGGPDGAGFGFDQKVGEHPAVKVVDLEIQLIEMVPEFVRESRKAERRLKTGGGPFQLN